MKTVTYAATEERRTRVVSGVLKSTVVLQFRSEIMFVKRRKKNSRTDKINRS